MPLVVVVVGVYTAAGLWLVASLIVTASLIYPSAYIPIGVTLVWILASFYFEYIPLLNQFDVRYLVSYTKFFVPRLPFSGEVQTLLSAALLLGVVAFGVHRIQRVDL